MSKAYPSNLTYAQYEFLSELIPEAKPGGRPRQVDIWQILNAILGSPSGGDTMASLAGVIFQFGKRCTPIFAPGALTELG